MRTPGWLRSGRDGNKEAEMIKTALVFFALAALGGLALGTMHIKKRDVPIGLALVHGLLAATGLVLLILGIGQAAAGGSVAALVIFVLAAMGGLFMFTNHLRRRRPPTAIILVHGAAAVTAFLVLLIKFLG